MYITFREDLAQPTFHHDSLPHPYSGGCRSFRASLDRKVSWPCQRLGTQRFPSTISSHTKICNRMIVTYHSILIISRWTKTKYVQVFEGKPSRSLLPFFRIACLKINHWFCECSWLEVWRVWIQDRILVGLERVLVIHRCTGLPGEPSCQLVELFILGLLFLLLFREGLLELAEISVDVTLGGRIPFAFSARRGSGGFKRQGISV